MADMPRLERGAAGRVSSSLTIRTKFGPGRDSPDRRRREEGSPRTKPILKASFGISLVEKTYGLGGLVI